MQADPRELTEAFLQIATARRQPSPAAGIHPVPAQPDLRGRLPSTLSFNTVVRRIGVRAVHAGR